MFCFCFPDGDLGAIGDGRSAYMKQKHRMIWERRHGKIGSGMKPQDWTTLFSTHFFLCEQRFSAEIDKEKTIKFSRHHCEKWCELINENREYRSNKRGKETVISVPFPEKYISVFFIQRVCCSMRHIVLIIWMILLQVKWMVIAILAWSLYVRFFYSILCQVSSLIKYYSMRLQIKIFWFELADLIKLV